MLPPVPLRAHAAVPGGGRAKTRGLGSICPARGSSTGKVTTTAPGHICASRSTSIWSAAFLSMGLRTPAQMATLICMQLYQTTPSSSRVGGNWMQVKRATLASRPIVIILLLTSLGGVANADGTHPHARAAMASCSGAITEFRTWAAATGQAGFFDTEAKMDGAGRFSEFLRMATAQRASLDVMLKAYENSLLTAENNMRKYGAKPEQETYRQDVGGRATANLGLCAVRYALGGGASAATEAPTIPQSDSPSFQPKPLARAISPTSQSVPAKIQIPVGAHALRRSDGTIWAIDHPDGSRTLLNPDGSVLEFHPGPALHSSTVRGWEARPGTFFDPKQHIPSQDAKRCVSFLNLGSGDSAIHGGNRLILNNCRHTIEVFLKFP
jgi:hypothetical protein